MGRVSRIVNSAISNDPNKQALIYLHTAVFLWGFTGVLGKAIDLNAGMLVVYRMLITAVIYLLYFWMTGIKFRLPRRDLLRLGGIGIIIAIHWIAFYGAIKLASISVAMVCLAMASLFTLFIDAIWNRKKLQRLELILGLLALLGVILIYLDNLDFKTGLIAGVIAAFLSGLFTVMNKVVIDRYKASVISFYEIGIGGLVVTMFIPVFQYIDPETTLVPDKWSFFYLILLSFFCTFLGQLLALMSLKNLSAFTASLSVNLEIVYGIILAFVFYHEQKLIGVNFYLGASLIIASVVMQSLFSARARRRRIMLGD